MQADEFLTLQEVADELKVPLATVHAWRYHGTAPTGVRIGRFVRVRRSDLEAWIAERRDPKRPAEVSR